MEYGEQVQLLLSAPGHPPVALPASPWRGWVWSDRGPIDPTTHAQGLRLSPVSPRAERALVAAVAADDVDTLGRLAVSTGPAQDAARVLTALRLANLDPPSAVELLTHLVQAPVDPTANKVLRRHWQALAVQVALAPSVPALFGVGRTSLGLLLAELLADLGRTGESLGVLETLAPSPPVVLSRSATLLALGEHQQVLALTVSMPNVDDVAALALVARSVAARAEHSLETALTAVCAALDIAERSPAVIAAALEERAHLYTMSGDAVAARSDLEALAAMATGRTDVPIPMPSTLKRVDDHDEGDGLDRARDRMRRRITGVGEPGTFGGRHHSTYRDEIATMFALGQITAVEELLLGLLDAVEDEVDELGVPLDATFFLTLADLYQDNGRSEDLMALRERYAAADARARAGAVEPEAGSGREVTGSPSLAKEPAGVAAHDTPTSEAGELAAAAEPAVAVPVADQAADEAVGVEAPAAVAVAAPVEPTGGHAPAGASGAVVVAAPEGEERVLTGEEAEERLADVLAGAPDDASALADPVADEAEADVDLAEPASEDAAGDPEAEPVEDPKPERELTPVERAVRGPRVRSL